MKKIILLEVLSIKLKEGFGSTKNKNIIRLHKDLSEDDKKNLNKLGFRFGVEYLYIPDLLKPVQLN